MHYANVDLSIPLNGDDLFNQRWDLPETWVEPPNQARGGISGVICTTFNQQAVYIKKQVGHIHRSFRHPWGRPTALREWESYGILASLGITTPEPLHCERRRVTGEWWTLLGTRALDGYFPLSGLPEQIAGLKRRLTMAVARTLAKLHRACWQHSALYPTHIFVRPKQDNFEVALLDLEKLHRQLTVTQASRHDMQPFLWRQHQWNGGDIQLLLDVYREALAGAK